MVNFHRSHKKLATITSTYPPGRFGAIETAGNQVRSFVEKPRGEGGLINAGFFVLDKQVLSYIEGDQTSWEQEPLKNLAADGQLMMHLHEGFWHPMDTLRDKNHLEEMWSQKKAPWKIWS